MRFASTFGALSAFAALAVAQTGDATDADAQLVQTQLYNVGNATVALDGVVLNFTGPADTNNLVTASSAVLSALQNGVTNIEPIQGNITLNQGVVYLLNPTYALNDVVKKAINDTINEKQLLVNSCLGPAVLETLQQQLNGSLAFRDAIVSKFSTGNQGLVINLSQPSIDQLKYGIGNFSDQTALPATCTSTSSATSSTPTPTALPTTSDADLAIVVQQFQNIESTTQQLDYAITNFTGTADVATLQADSNTVISTINAAVNAVNAIGPYITLGQASNSLLPQLNILKPLVNQTVTDAENAKSKFVAACVGPQILDALKQQYTAAVAFANAVADKIDPSYKALTLQLSQPVIDSLQQGIDYFSDQTSLPASCTATSSSAVPTSTSSIVTITSSSVVVTTTPVSTPVTTTSTSEVPTTSSTVIVAPSTTRVSSPASSAAATPISASSVSPPRASSSSGAAVSSPVSSAKVSTPVSSQKASSTGAVSSPASSPVIGVGSSAVSSPASSAKATSVKASSTAVKSSPVVVSSPTTLITSVRTSSTSPIVITTSSTSTAPKTTSTPPSTTTTATTPTTTAATPTTTAATTTTSAPAFALPTLPGFSGIALPTINFSLPGFALPTNIAGLFGGL